MNPFIALRNDPLGIFEWIHEKVILAQDLQNFYKVNANSLYLMWSAQNSHSDQCSYPRNDKCGKIVDFGAWNSKSFTQFLKIVMDHDHTLVAGNKKNLHRAAGHGIFNFNNIPISWFPENQRTNQYSFLGEHTQRIIRLLFGV